MSRIGKKPVVVPKGVTVTIDGSTVTVKGPKGTLTRTFDPRIKISLVDDQVIVERTSEEKRGKGAPRNHTCTHSEYGYGCK